MINLRKSANHKAQIRDSLPIMIIGLIFVLYDLQIFSSSVYHLEQPHAQPILLFPVVWGINFIPFFDGKKDGSAAHSIIVSFSSSLTCRTIS